MIAASISMRTTACLNWRLRLQTSGIYRVRAIPGWQTNTGGAAATPPPALVWPRGQRSGCIPAEPYPLLRSGSV